MELFIVAQSHSAADNIAFDAKVMSGLRYQLLDPAEHSSSKFVHSLVATEEPDVVFIGGWSHSPYVKLASSRAISRVHRVLMLDNPRRDDLRQKFARLKIGRFLDNMDSAFVAGERCWQFAKYLGIPENKIHRGTYGIDYEGIKSKTEVRWLNNQWPESFLFVGRYDKIKGLDVLISAYQTYRQQVKKPWALHCCGTGPLKPILNGVNGVVDHGFVQPADLPRLFVDSGVFVLPSMYDPWPLVIVESCAAGLPIICTEACGSSVETVRSLYNGLIVPTADTEALAAAFLWMHNHGTELAEMGRRSQGFAAAFSAKAWADRVLTAVHPALSRLQSEPPAQVRA